jgi:flagellar motor switch protein FliN/FliY
MPDTARFTIAFSNALGAAAVADLGTELQVLPVAGDGGEDPALIADALAIAIQFAGGLVGDLYLCPDQDASRSLFPAAESASPGDLSSAWLALLQGSATGMAEALRDHFGEVRLGNCRVEAISGQLVSVGALRLNGASTCQGTISLFGDAALLKSLERSSINSGGEVHGLSVTDPEADAAASFERVIDVPLGVTLRFGQRQLSLRELLELNMGSLVELDRQVDEPVDLMLGERLIARGEVVIVDGNYGMRVTEVIEQPARRGVDH